MYLMSSEQHLSSFMGDFILPIIAVQVVLPNRVAVVTETFNGGEGWAYATPKLPNNMKVCRMHLFWHLYY